MKIVQMFTGKVIKDSHIGFEDLSDAVGSSEFIEHEFCRIRDEIKKKLLAFYVAKIKNKN